MAWGKEDNIIPIIDVPTKPFGQVMKEFNEEAELKINKNSWGETWDKSNFIIGVDKGSKDTTVVGLHDGNKLNIIGESVELTINTGPWKSKTVQAIQIGDLAVYFGDEEDVGLVIHVPTLTRFDRAIPDGEWTQDQLISWCWKVQQGLYNDWQFLRSLNNKTYREDFAAKEAILNHCLSIGVE